MTITTLSTRSGPAHVVTLAGGRFSVLISPRTIRYTVILIATVLMLA